MSRWLLVLLTALILLGSQVTTWAAAGVIGQSECCCPVKARCRCHDHQGDRPDRAPVLQKCGGKAELVAPLLLAAVVPRPPQLPSVTPVALAIVHRLAPMPETFAREPETPPF